MKTKKDCPAAVRSLRLEALSMKLMRVQDAVGQVLCHDITQLMAN